MTPVMPELPEVETVARRLQQDFIGRTVVRLWCNWPRMAAPGWGVVRARLPGRRVAAVGRRAKWVVWRFDEGGRLLLHLRMSGHPSTVPAGTRPVKHVHFVIEFDDGMAMHLSDARKFARIHWADDVSVVRRSGQQTRPEGANGSDPLAALGIEPLSDEFTPAWLFDALRRRSRQLKPALLDQTFIAGLGNIYADETLFRARLHPLRTTDSLRRPEAERLWTAIRAALAEGIRRNGASIDWVYPGGEMQEHFLAYGRTGEPCGRCRGAIQRIVVAQRGTHLCPRCQRA